MPAMNAMHRHTQADATNSTTTTMKRRFKRATRTATTSRRIPTFGTSAHTVNTMATNDDDDVAAAVAPIAWMHMANSMASGNLQNNLRNGSKQQQQQQLTPMRYELWTQLPMQSTNKMPLSVTAAQPFASLVRTATAVTLATAAPLTLGTAQALSGWENGTDTTMAAAASILLLPNATVHADHATDLASIADVDSYLMGMAWPKALIVAIFLFLILLTVIGNTLVILAVLTTRRLRTVTNCFVMNLAITDWLVGTCVMPPAVILYIVGSWRFGWILCDIWISLDVLLCTGSILSLCAISLDRYLAVTQPLTYSKKRRSKRLALFMIFIVWVTALSITCPPYLGWYEPGRRQAGYVVCRYNQNKGYVVFSAMGSFFIPLSVMLYVYLKIGYVLTSRRQRIVRDANSERTADNDIDCDNFLSESEQIHCGTPKFPSFKTRWSSGGAHNASKNNSLKCSKCQKPYLDQTSIKHQASFYELVEISRLSSLIHCTAVGCKYGCVTSANGNLSCMHGSSALGASSLPRHLLQHNDSRTSFPESCITGITTIPTVGAGTAVGGGAAGVGSAAYSMQHQHHVLAHNQHHHPAQHHAHRIPMRISTTKRDTKTAKTLTIVMGGFIACWLPFFVYYLLIPFLPTAYVFEGLMSFLTWVGWVNCAINPFIYAFYNPDFRTAFWRLTCRRVCKQKPPAHHMAMFRG